jgi:hypothetical protein
LARRAGERPLPVKQADPSSVDRWRRPRLGSLLELAPQFRYLLGLFLDYILQVEDEQPVRAVVAADAGPAAVVAAPAGGDQVRSSVAPERFFDRTANGGVFPWWNAAI